MLDELPEGAVEDAVFRLTLAVLAELGVGRVWMPVTYFCLWDEPADGVDAGAGELPGVRDAAGGAGPVWYSATTDGVTCGDDRRPGAVALSAAGVAEAMRMFRGTVAGLAEEEWPKARGTELRHFAIELLERHLERRLLSARALARA